MTNAPPIAESFGRILRWADSNLPLLRESLRPPASDGEIDALEALMGQTLPRDVRDLYRLADGQTPYEFGRTYYPGLFLGLPFNPIQTVTRDWRDIDGAINRIAGNTSEYLTSFPPDVVKTVDLSRGWTPLSDDDGGNHMAIDLDPGPAGNMGQWIIFEHDNDERVRVASSLAAFLSWAATEMEAGHFAPARAEERHHSARDLRALRAGIPVAVPDPPSEDEWRWRNHGHLHDGLRSYLKTGGQIG